MTRRHKLDELNLAHARSLIEQWEKWAAEYTALKDEHALGLARAFGECARDMRGALELPPSAATPKDKP